MDAIGSLPPRALCTEPKRRFAPGRCAPSGWQFVGRVSLAPQKGALFWVSEVQETHPSSFGSGPRTVTLAAMAIEPAEVDEIRNHLLRYTGWDRVPDEVIKAMAESATRVRSS